MTMDRHKCKLCLKTFSNGRGLGDHMKVHLTNLPLPSKAEHQQLGYRSSSSSFSSWEEDESRGEEEVARHVQVEEKEKALVYALRENPKKSFRLADPEFSFAVDVGGEAVVQDRESETESKKTTRRRAKRDRGKPGSMGISELKKPRTEKLSFPESPSEPVSSVSYTSPEEDVAMYLMMLSRDTWSRDPEEQDDVEQQVRTFEKKRKGPKDDPKSKRIGGKHPCDNCRKTFRSSRALNSHKRICFPADAIAGRRSIDKFFQCPFCFELFGSGQALGGHKRSHLIGLSSVTAASAKSKETFLDLNLPAPAEEEDFEP